MLAIFLFAAALSSVSSQSDPCDGIKPEVDCLKANGWGCNWCISAAVPSACRDWDVAKHLPPGAFTCGNASRTDCESNKDNATCATQVGCAWCSSMTVKPSCQNYMNASHLPPSVFSCTGPY